ncbi:MAG TPA: hypothetical protein VG733_03005 [Chthoniobacteraceae bacterium]|nr:hypothetical protein [Chthoniobacteraceae bacterium]
MKKILITAALSVGLLAAPFHLRAGDSTASTTPAPTVGKKHIDVNAWLDQHPKLKDKVLAKFDTNHNGKLDGDEIPAFLKWLKERQEKRKDSKEDGGETTKTTPPAITSPIISN